jgi:hypothetical protein
MSVPKPPGGFTDALERPVSVDRLLVGEDGQALKGEEKSRVKIAFAEGYIAGNGNNAFKNYFVNSVVKTFRISFRIQSG